MGKIEWCDKSINPLGWGCYGPTGTAKNPKPCEYCFARKFAERNIRKCPECRAFMPHWHPEQLRKPYKWRNPRIIFVQSMGDLFHKETPRVYIEATLAACRDNPRHTYMFLTKNPERYAEFCFRPTEWLGATMEGRGLCGRAYALKKVLGSYPPEERPRSFLSIEPIVGKIPQGFSFSFVDKLIVGAMTGHNAVKPKKEWLESVLALNHKDLVIKKNALAFFEEYGLVF